MNLGSISSRLAVLCHPSPPAGSPSHLGGPGAGGLPQGGRGRGLHGGRAAGKPLLSTPGIRLRTTGAAFTPGAAADVCPATPPPAPLLLSRVAWARPTTARPASSPGCPSLCPAPSSPRSQTLGCSGVLVMDALILLRLEDSSVYIPGVRQWHEEHHAGQPVAAGKPQPDWTLGESIVQLGQNSVMVAGGMESMSNVPYYMK